MVQSLKLGAGPSDGTGAGIRRINRLPIILVIALTVVFLAVIFYGLTSRGLYFRSGPSIGESSGNLASTYADQLKRGISDGIIGEPQPAMTFQPTPVETAGELPEDNPFAPQPGAAHPEKNSELEPEEIWRARLEREQQEQYLRERHRQQMARLQANDAAYDAPIAVDRSKLDGRMQSTNNSGSAPSVQDRQPGSATDLYAAALRAGLAGQDLDPNGQNSKKDFFNTDINELGYLPNRVVAQQSSYELKRGSVIPASLITGINSDLPGRITAQVSQNVFDSATGHRLLIPQGTKLFGRYDSKVAFGQNRVLVVWTDIIFPNGSTLQIGGMAGTDGQGYGGLRDKVDRKWLQTFGSAILIAIIGAGVDMAIPQDRYAFGSANGAEDAARRNFAETFGRVADRTIQRNMDVQPTLEIRPGYKFNVLVDQDIVFPGSYAD
ncbi:IncP-type conjugal transfer protein TrbI [Mesorhizobium sp. CGMCC 1.15528]|uniref:IncP-type conjugal transfer protein TrbI n=1 Tax=Mesorhizobium zhangyense TaxID=1776730 RepID=A0A7C9VFA1_9HYPH|nr:IncP-type conjugal transfer protein TrbI [Mesorhizobium zhangyense]NGN43532.1 IncP-type conjugal transfer protein TrbI [Mesorhizobium zhangyense]